MRTGRRLPEFGVADRPIRLALAVVSITVLIAVRPVRSEIDLQAESQSGAESVATPSTTGAADENASQAAAFGAAARSAGKLCKSRDLEGALFALGALREGLAIEYGATHPVTQLVDLSLGRVEASLGVDATPLGLGIQEAPEASPPREVDASLSRALKKLRSCASLPPYAKKPEEPVPELLESIEGGFEPHIRAARELARKGHYGAAAAAAERAHQLAMQDRDPLDRLRAAEAVAILRLQIGDFEGAVESAREADAAAASQGALRTRISMARLLAQVRHLDEARSRLDELESAAVADPRLRPEFYEARGDLAIRLGSPRRAIRLLDEALEGHEAQFGGAHPSTAAVFHLRGSAHQMAGDLPAAKSDYGRAREIRKEVYGARHPEVARTLNALGVLHSGLKDWAEAERLFHLALEYLMDGLGREHPEVVTVRANQVLVAWARDRNEAAAEAYADVIRALAHAYGSKHPTLSDARRNLAHMREVLGDTQGAEALLDLALAAQASFLGETHPALAVTLIARGKFLGRQNRLEDAHASLTRAIDLLKQHYGKDHPLVARAHTVRSNVAAARGDSALAWSDAQLAARVFDLHLYRSFGAMPDRQRALLAVDAAGVVGALLSANTGDARETYVAMIPQRDAVLRSIAKTRAEARQSIGVARAALDELERLRELYVAAVLSESPTAAERARDLATQIDTQETVASLAQGTRRDLEASEILHQACLRLPENGALVEFVGYDRVLPAEGVDPRPQYLALVVRPNSVNASSQDCSVSRIELGAAAEIDSVADQFALKMRDQINDAPELRAQLGKLLLGPLKNALAGADRWLLIPDGSLWGVPFSALPDPENPEQYLIERVTSGTLTSIHELTPSKERVFAIEPVSLLFGAPEFGVSEVGGGPVVLTSFGPCRLDPFEPLPGTVQELKEISELLPNSRLVLGPEATKSRLYDELKRQPSILHLATHAYFAGGGGCDGTVSSPAEGIPSARGPIAPNPLLLSGIVFAGANLGQRIGEASDQERTSGILTAYEASGLDLSSSRLVVLSACDTGTGLHRRGQEVQGLRWGFRAAGAKSLVTSLWRSNDIVTRKLMRRFYESLAREGAAADLFEGAEALRLAQLDRVAREKKLNLKKPLTWANFVFSGLY